MVMAALGKGLRHVWLVKVLVHVEIMVVEETDVMVLGVRQCAGHTLHIRAEGPPAVLVAVRGAIAVEPIAKDTGLVGGNKTAVAKAIIAPVLKFARTTLTISHAGERRRVAVGVLTAPVEQFVMLMPVAL